MRFPYCFYFGLLIWFMVLPIPSIAYAQEDQWLCEGSMNLSHYNKGKLLKYTTKGLNKRVIHRVMPKTPSNCRCKGTIWVDLVINKEGVVQCVRTQEGHPLLKQAAVEAAKQWKFKPMNLKEGKVAITGRVPFRFYY